MKSQVLNAVDRLIREYIVATYCSSRIRVLVPGVVVRGRTVSYHYRVSYCILSLSFFAYAVGLLQDIVRYTYGTQYPRGVLYSNPYILRYRPGTTYR